MILWDGISFAQLASLEGHQGAVTRVSFSQDDSLLVSASEGKTLRLWDISSRSCLRVLEGHSSRVRDGDSSEFPLLISHPFLRLDPWPCLPSSKLPSLEPCPPHSLPISRASCCACCSAARKRETFLKTPFPRGFSLCMAPSRDSAPSLAVLASVVGLSNPDSSSAKYAKHQENEA